MKKFMLLLGLLFLSVTAFAQKGPVIVFKAKDNTIDYGKIFQGEDNGKRVFEFTNEGDAPLIIKDVQSTCGCAIPSKPKDRILPGKSGQIEVQYNMQPGPIRKSITVESNAVNGSNGKVHLKIKGEVLVKPAGKSNEAKKSGTRQ